MSIHNLRHCIIGLCAAAAIGGVLGYVLAEVLK